MKEAKLVMQARLLLHGPDGSVEDWTHHKYGGLKGITREGFPAIDIVKDCENRLQLLKAALRGRKTIETEHVRTIVDDLLVDLEHEATMPNFIRLSVDLFNDAELLPPLVTQPGKPGLRTVEKKTSPEVCA